MFGGVHRKLLCLSVWASMATETVNPYSSRAIFQLYLVI